MSASLWGCELKWIPSSNHRQTGKGQPPCEAVSWNTSNPHTYAWWSGQPPCEAVSWNVKSIIYFTSCNRQPPCEAVSWNTHLISPVQKVVRQPPCEAVSWNVQYDCKDDHHGEVSLLVRLWVEIHHEQIWYSCCNRQPPPCEAVSWNDRVADDR